METVNVPTMFAVFFLGDGEIRVWGSRNKVFFDRLEMARQVNLCPEHGHWVESRNVEGGYVIKKLYPSQNIGEAKWPIFVPETGTEWWLDRNRNLFASDGHMSHRFVWNFLNNPYDRSKEIEEFFTRSACRALAEVVTDDFITEAMKLPDPDGEPPIPLPVAAWEEPPNWVALPKLRPSGSGWVRTEWRTGMRHYTEEVPVSTPAVDKQGILGVVTHSSGSTMLSPDERGYRTVGGGNYFQVSIADGEMAEQLVALAEHPEVLAAREKLFADWASRDQRYTDHQRQVEVYRSDLRIWWRWWWNGGLTIAQKVKVLTRSAPRFPFKEDCSSLKPVESGESSKKITREMILKILQASFRGILR